MPVNDVKPFAEWSAAELMGKLDDILRTTPRENLGSLVSPLQKTLEAAKLQLASAEAELRNFSLTGNLDPVQLAALTEFFLQPSRAAVVAAKNKVFVAERALDYVKKQMSKLAP